MGVGDWLMATGQVKTMFAVNGRPVVVVGATGRPQWSEVFERNPKILIRPTGNCQYLRNGSNARPYIEGKDAQRWHWKKFGPEPGELIFSAQEQAFAAPHSGMIMVEPNVKTNDHKNKAWSFDRWQALVDLKIGQMMQCGVPNVRWLNGVKRVMTPTFRHACAVLAVSRAFVGTEGGLHHASAALNVPAVVLWSEFIDPSITGYTNQRNIRHAERTCGMRIPCPTCIASMEAITVDEVALNLREILV